MRLTSARSICGCWLRLALVFFAAAESTEAAVGEHPDLLLLEVRLESRVLSEAIAAYDAQGQILLPLEGLARLLTVAIKANPRAGTAEGFVLTEDRGFSLSVADARVTRSGSTEAVDPASLLVEPDDVYVAQSLLERWLPVDLEVDRSRLTLRVFPREVLPLQSREARVRRGGRAAAGGAGPPTYPEHRLPYRLASVPFVDQSIATHWRRDEAGAQHDARYTAFLTGDALGMESALYLSHASGSQASDVRASLGRSDPHGNLLGPLKARSFRLGSMSTPSVGNVVRAVDGEGVSLSNRPLTQPTTFDSQTFEGDLAPGWDVELYYNDALVGYQAAAADGRYRFEDQPLSYGQNDFRLVFRGPLGQTRVEQSSYSLDQSMVRPGEFQYSLSEHHGNDGRMRSLAQVDLGLSRRISASAGFISAPVAGEREQFARVGLRTFLSALSVSGDLTRTREGGSLAEVGLQTRAAGVAVDASRALFDGFTSEMFQSSADPLRTRDEVRLSGSIPAGSRSRLPVSLDASREKRESGATNTEINARLSAYVFRTAITHNLRWHAWDDLRRTTGRLQVSRRVGTTSVRGHVDYGIGTGEGITGVTLSADQALSDGYRINLGVARDFASTQTRYRAGFSKTMGRYGLSVNASYSSTGEVFAGARLSVSMGRDPLGSSWQFDARPTANRGAASLQMFLDGNGNGIMDAGEQPLSGAGFTVDGGRHKARTDGNGIAHLDHLPIERQVDIGVDTGTLADPQWAPQQAGVSLVPRPGRVAQLQFPVDMTSEIDGTVSLYERGAVRGIGDIELELLDEERRVVSTTMSSWDGFYIFSGVRAGDYWVRVSPEQLKRLELAGTGIQGASVLPDGDFVSGIDLAILGTRPKQSPPSQARIASSAPRGEAEVRFTIQLMAASSEAAVRGYINRHQLQQEAVYSRTTRDHGPWYVVLYGAYSRYDQALAALRELPPALTGASPWVRPYGGLPKPVASARYSAGTAR